MLKMYFGPKKQTLWFQKSWMEPYQHLHVYCMLSSYLYDLPMISDTSFQLHQSGSLVMTIPKYDAVGSEEADWRSSLLLMTG